jgi:hypothetical protein
MEAWMNRKERLAREAECTGNTKVVSMVFVAAVAALLLTMRTPSPISPPEAQAKPATVEQSGEQTGIAASLHLSQQEYEADVSAAKQDDDSAAPTF